MSPWKSTLDRLPKHASSLWEAREAFEEALRTDYAGGMYPRTTDAR